MTALALVLVLAALVGAQLWVLGGLLPASLVVERPLPQGDPETVQPLVDSAFAQLRASVPGLTRGVVSARVRAGPDGCAYLRVEAETPTRLRRLFMQFVGLPRVAETLLGAVKSEPAQPVSRPPDRR